MMGAKRKDRRETEDRILDAVSSIVVEQGLEKVGINNVASVAGISKVLIYRYFDSLDGLVDTWLEKHSFWVNVPKELLPSASDDLETLKEKATALFTAQLDELFASPLARRVLLWQLSSDQGSAVRIRETIEQRGTMITDLFATALPEDSKDIHALTSLLLGGVYYLSLAQDTAERFNGVELHTAGGKERLRKAAGMIVEGLFV